MFGWGQVSGVCLRRATGAASPHPEDHYIPAVHRLGMPYAIISDIHANLEALDVVLADIAARQPDAVVCLGDFVGYGPDPVACVRSEEHTSELQSPYDLVCRLLLEKKKKKRMP